MSFEVALLITVIILAVAMPVIGVFCFKSGYQLGIKDYNDNHRDAPKADITAKKAVKVPTVDKTLKKYASILENIENYDGTGANQKDVEVI